MTESDEHVAALNDPDAQPLTEESLARMRLVPRTKTMRRALGLTQEAFAARYRIPLGTLRDWEQGRGKPDQTARAHLTVMPAIRTWCRVRWSLARKREVICTG